MKLYVLEIIGDNRIKFPITLEGSDSGADEGSWSTPPSGIYLGQTSGYWSVSKDQDGLPTIWLLEDENPNIVSWLWRDSPLAIASIGDVLKLPLYLGETGNGTIMPRNFESNRMRWKVVERGF